MIIGYIFSVFLHAYLRRKTLLVSQDGMYMNINEYRDFTSYKDRPEHLGFISRAFIRGIGVVCATSGGMIPIIFVNNPGIGSLVSSSLIASFLLFGMAKINYSEYGEHETMKDVFLHTPKKFINKGKYITKPLIFREFLYELEMKKAKIQEKNRLIEKKEQKLEKATVEGNEKKMKKHTSSLEKLGKELKQMENEVNSILDKIESCVSDRPTPAMYKILKRNATLGKDLAPTSTILKTDQAVDFLNVLKVSEDEVPKQRYHIEVLENIKQNENLPEEIRKEAEEILELHRLQEDVEKKEETFKDVELDLKVARNIVENNGDMRRSISENII